MANYKQLFMEHMDAKEVRYEGVDERVVKIDFSADNMKSIEIFVLLAKTTTRISA